ncbi:MAG: alpha-1,4-glucan--maltose-1-phosphate maltosyltransferase [Pirellulales bacterium]|nr:alpha-1,4-glucan--maltose-1-phosphate maltosyltransferase [Pirellulales bacterium]
MKPAHRIAIDRIYPDVDGGRFAAKCIANRLTTVAADIVCDGHDVLTCSLHLRRPNERLWTTIPMTDVGNDRWEAVFTPEQLGTWEYTVSGGVDRFQTWLRDLKRRKNAGDDLCDEMLEGQQLIDSVLESAPTQVAEQLSHIKFVLTDPAGYPTACSTQLASLMAAHADHSEDTWLDISRRICVERERAAVGAWYEAFPRSWGKPGAHGTLCDLANSIDYIASMGFDVLYLPPIHPIGQSFRKGKNNSVQADAEEVGSPWGIGSIAGGHTDIHPELGTLDDFLTLWHAVSERGMELALDLALQCSPDHPWVTDHPEWFRHRADGSIRYAENPPKKYQDIYPLDFETEGWQELWHAVREILEFWISQGVRIFRVDNPHTKPFDFWEWLLDDVRQTHPDVLFLAEAFTRPKTMYRLAKIGFTQSYTYFTWRTKKQELAEYLEEVTSPPVADYFRPNFFTNTPDILHETLQRGGRPMFKVRLALAALSVGNWGIYGPAMELQETTPREPGSEEYLNSEKYEIRLWDRQAPHTLAPFITRLNEIRKSEAAIRDHSPPVIETTGDPFLLAWSRYEPATKNHLLIVVNLKPEESRTDTVELIPDQFGESLPTTLAVTDLFTGEHSTRPLKDFQVTCTPTDPVIVLRLLPNPNSRSADE